MSGTYVLIVGGTSLNNDVSDGNRKGRTSIIRHCMLCRKPSRKTGILSRAIGHTIPVLHFEPEMSIWRETPGNSSPPHLADTGHCRMRVAVLQERLPSVYSTWGEGAP